MKEWMKRVFAAVLCIMLIISLVRIHSLKEKLERETGYLQSQIESLQNSINSIYHNVDQKLEEEASLLTFQDWNLASLDVQEKTASVEVSIIPKEYQAGMTEAIVQSGSEEYPMTMKDGAYCAEIEVPLFDMTTVDAVVLRDSTYTRTEYLGWNISPRQSMLPDVYADISGGWSFGPRGKEYSTLTSDGEIGIHIEAKGSQPEIKSIYLIESLDGQVQERTAVPMEGQDGYYTVACKETYELPFETCFEMAVEVTDKYGLVYKAIVHRWESDEKGQLVDDTDWFGRSAAIYSQDGKLLYMD